MNVGSLFSGIGGLDLGLARAGFRHAFFCESDAWRREVLAKHWPGVPIYEDVARVGRLQPEDGGAPEWDAQGGGALSLDLLCGGFPCQDVSIAGRRAGLAGERSGLFHEFARIAESLRPRWLLVENVPGLLSSNGGRDFGVVLGTLADIGYGVAWRIVDSRFFGVPQRRRRVFILGALADGDTRAAAERAGEVLAVGTRCPGHPATGAEARENLAGTLGGGSGSPGWAQDTERMTFVAHALRRDPGGIGQRHNTTFIAAPLSHGSNPNSNMAGRRREDDESLVTAFYPNEGGHGRFHRDDGVSPTLKVGSGTGAANGMGISDRHGVRRLTPTECERLQALPDGWTDFGPDSRRYAALGDAVTASVSEWIGRRLIAA